MLNNLQYYQQQLLLWVEFSQHSQQSGEAEIAVLHQAWERAIQTIKEYLGLKKPSTVEFLLIFFDGLILQRIYGRGFRDSSWFREQFQQLIQMVLLYEQSSTQAQ